MPVKLIVGAVIGISMVVVGIIRLKKASSEHEQPRDKDSAFELISFGTGMIIMGIIISVVPNLLGLKAEAVNGSLVSLVVLFAIVTAILLGVLFIMIPWKAEHFKNKSWMIDWIAAGVYIAMGAMSTCLFLAV